MTRREAWMYYARKIGARGRPVTPVKREQRKVFMGAVMSYRGPAFGCINLSPRIVLKSRDYER